MSIKGIGVTLTRLLIQIKELGENNNFLNSLVLLSVADGGGKTMELKIERLRGSNWLKEFANGLQANLSPRYNQAKILQVENL